MPARNEPPLAGRSRFGPKCASAWIRWLSAGAASLLAVACFLNPKTDDLPKFDSAPPVVGGVPPSGDDPGVPSNGGFGDNLLPGESPPLGVPEPSPTPDRGADAGTEPNADAGSDAD